MEANGREFSGATMRARLVDKRVILAMLLRPESARRILDKTESGRISRWNKPTNVAEKLMKTKKKERSTDAFGRIAMASVQAKKMNSEDEARLMSL